MSSTVQQIINIAFEKLGIIGAGGAPETADSVRAVASLKGYYQKLINSGTFGDLIDVIPVSSPYLAGENERIVHDGTITIVKPTTLPAIYAHADYGIIVYGEDLSLVRPPRDLAIISEVRTDSGAIKDWIYDNRLRAWTDINALTAISVAPLSHRDEDGLACNLAVRLAAHFGQQVTQEIMTAAVRFEEALTHNWSQAGQIIEPKDFF